MAIYLDQQTGPTLKTIVTKYLESHPLDFIAKRILSSIEADDRWHEQMRTCEHHIQNLKGKKRLCTKCQGAFEYEIWEADE